MVGINWLHRRTGARVSLAALLLLAVATAIGVANAITPNSTSISSSAASGPDGVMIATFDADSNQKLILYCNQAVADYNVQPGALNSDGSMKIGTVPNMAWSGCSGPFGAQLEISLTDVWRVSAISPLTGGVGTIRLDEIAVAATGGGCSLTVRGSINAELNLNEKTLTADPESADLTVSEVVGCSGMVADGDKATVEGIFILL